MGTSRVPNKGLAHAFWILHAQLLHVSCNFIALSNWQWPSLAQAVPACCQQATVSSQCRIPNTHSDHEAVPASAQALSVTASHC